jgi:hypothetical protein
MLSLYARELKKRAEMTNFLIEVESRVSVCVVRLYAVEINRLYLAIHVEFIHNITYLFDHLIWPHPLGIEFVNSG